MAERAPSIRRSILRRATLTTAVALIGSGLAVYLLARVALYAEFDSGLATIGRALAALVERGPEGVPDIDLGAVSDVVPTGARFQLWSAKGHLLAGDEDLLPWTATEGLGQDIGSRLVTAVPAADGSRKYRCLILRCRLHREVHLPGEAPVAVVMADSAEVDRALHRLGWLLVGVMVVTLATMTVVQVRSLDRGLRPLRDLAEEIARLGPEDLSHRFGSDHRPRELAVIGQRLDAMVERLAAAIDHERRFGAAMAHELRTPLAGLRATLEVGLIDPSTPDSVRPRLESCLAMGEQMERLVEALLTLDRLASGRERPRALDVDLPAVVRRAWDEVAMRAAERGITATFDLPDSARWCADPRLTVLVLRNLVGNAVDHGLAGGEVAFRAEGGRLTISNPGSSVASADAAMVFDRFWRGDGARSDSLHCGLGLALCRESVTAMGGTISATSEDGGRFTVTVVLPQALTELLPNDGRV